MCGQKDSPDEFRFSPVLIGAFCVLIYPFFGQFPAHFLVCAVHGAEGGVGRGQGVLSGKVDIGLSLAEQLDGISGFVPTKLINTVAYKLKMEALSHQGTSRQLGEKWSVSQISESSNESERQIHRYIRLTNLIPELLEFMDEGKMALSVGVELSFLDEQSQRNVLEQCEINDCTPSYAQAVRMRKAFSNFALTADMIRSIMSEEKANQRETVKIPTEKLRKFAPGANPQQLEDFILKACEYYRKYLRR